MIEEKVECKVQAIVKQYVDPLIKELRLMIKPSSNKPSIKPKVEVSIKKRDSVPKYYPAKRPLSTSSSKKSINQADSIKSIKTIMADTV